MKLYEIADTSDKQQLNEMAFLIPLVAGMIGSGMRKANRALKRIARNAPPPPKNPEDKDKSMLRKGAEGLGRLALDNPMTTVAAGGLAAAEYGPTVISTITQAKDIISTIAAEAGKVLSSSVVQSLAKIVVNYGLPIIAIAAIIYGGKKLYDYMKREEPGSDITVTECFTPEELEELRLLIA